PMERPTFRTVTKGGEGSAPAFRVSAAARTCSLLAFLACMIAGCGERPARSHVAAAPADFSAPPASSASAASPTPTFSSGPAVPRMVIGRFISPPDSAQAPVELDTSKPTAEHASLEAVRDTIEAILRRSVSLPDTAIHFRRERVKFDYHWARGSGAGWAFHVIVNDTTPCPQDKL